MRNFVYEKFLEFLDLRATATELAPQQTSQKKPHLPFRKSSKFTSPENGIQNVSVYAANIQVKCVACSGQKHNLAYCHAFKAKSTPDKQSFVLEHRLCFNGLKAKHTSKKCPSPNCCLKCGKQHHTFLHQDDSNDPVTQDTLEKTKQDAFMVSIPNPTNVKESENTAGGSGITSVSYVTAPEAIT